MARFGGNVVGMVILLCGISLMFGGAYVRASIVYPPPEFNNPVSVMGLIEENSRVMYIEVWRSGISKDGSMDVWATPRENVFYYIDNVPILGGGRYSGFGETISIKFVYENKEYVLFENVDTPSAIGIYNDSLAGEYVGLVISADLIDNVVDNFYLDLIHAAEPCGILQIENENFVYHYPENLNWGSFNIKGFKIIKAKGQCGGFLNYEGNYPIIAEECELKGYIKLGGDMSISMIGTSSTPDGDTVDNGFRFHLIVDVESFESVCKNNKIITTGKGYLTYNFDICLYSSPPYDCWGYGFLRVPVILTTVFPVEVQEIVLSDISTYMLITGLVLSLLGGGMLYTGKGVGIPRWR